MTPNELLQQKAPYECSVKDSIFMTRAESHFIYFPCNIRIENLYGKNRVKIEREVSSTYDAI